MKLNFLERQLYKAYAKMQLKSMSFSQLLPITKTTQPIWTDWSSEKAVKDGLKASSYVYTSISKIAKATASVEWKVYQRNRDGVWEEVPGHPLELLIRRPNPYLSQKEYIQTMIYNLYLAGNSIDTKVRGLGGVVAELWPLRPDSIKPVPDKKDFIKHYVYNYEGVKQIIPAADVMHNKFVDPSNPYWGLAPLQVVAKTVDTDVEAVNWNKVSLQNRAVADGAFVTDQPLNAEQWEEARRQVREQHQGSKNARSPWILGGGAKWVQMSLSPAEMDFIESRKMTREEIASLFGVPMPLLGINDVTYANYAEARKAFWQDTIIPLLDDIQDSFNLSLTPEFGDDNIELRYDASNVPALQENFATKLDNAKALFSMGVPFNQINQRLELGFDDIEGGDEGYIPSSLIPVSLARFDGSDDDEPDEEPNNEPKEDDDDDQGKSKGMAAADNQKKAELFFALKGIKTDTDQKRKMFWKNIERQRQPFYAAMVKDLNKLFEQQANKASRAYKKDRLRGFYQAIDETTDDWQKVFVKHYRRTISHFGEQVFQDITKAYGPMATKEDDEPIKFDPWDEEIEKYIFTVTAHKVANVLEFTKSHIADIIREMRTEENATVDEVARRIRDEIGLFSTHRSFRIARTEIVSANNYGSLRAATLAEQYTGPLKKMWVSSRDDRVRASHSHTGVDGETRNIDEEFSNGLLHPGDMRPGTPADEVVHCRCAMTYQRA